MFNELQVKVGNSEKKIFLQTERSVFSNHMSTTHTHSFTEVHVVSQGVVSFIVADTPYTLTAGNILAVPPTVRHLCTNTDDNNRYANFYINASLETPRLISLDPAIAATFIDEYATCQQGRNFSKLAAFISLFCSYIFENETMTVEKLTNHSLAIVDYFNKHFADGTLTGLANELFLSEKQTQRLVLKYTGRTFKQNIAYYRMQVARQLLQAGGMSKKEIAEYVGYESYSGFYKALLEYNEPDSVIQT